MVQMERGIRDCKRSACCYLIALSSVSLLLLSGPAAGPVGAQSASAPQGEVSEEIAPYLTPQRLIHIAKDRAINLVCLGHGSPTVVLTSGLGGWSQVWYRIQGAASRATRVCAWDPAGLGFSSPSPEPQDAFNEAKDLETVLKVARVDGPYVMVAHSAGAFVAIRFADEHPGDVVGMVLVDPSIPDQVAIRERIAPKFAAFGNGGPAAAAERLRQCAAKLQSRALKRGTPGFDECTAQPMPDEFSRLSMSLSQLNAHPARLLTQASALAEAGAESPREIINPHRNYGDMPLVVLTSGQHPFPPNTSTDVLQQAEVYFQALGSGHKAYAALSTRGRDQPVPDSGHFIQFDNPAVVSEAINSVLAEIRSQPADKSMAR
jgi:pimeloyl-ACP methyl ester carboxylesterase